MEDVWKKKCILKKYFIPMQQKHWYLAINVGKFYTYPASYSDDSLPLIHNYLIYTFTTTLSNVVLDFQIKMQKVLN